MRSLRSQLSLWLRRLADWLTPRTQAALPDDPLLDDLIEHVAYEMAAMAAAAKLWKSSGLWIALEDFLLHARVLREFFWKPWYAENRHASSAVHAEHYYPPWRGRSGGMSSGLATACGGYHQIGSAVLFYDPRQSCRLRLHQRAYIADGCVLFSCSQPARSCSWAG